MYLCERVDSRERSIDGCAVLKDNTGETGDRSELFTYLLQISLFSAAVLKALKSAVSDFFLY